MSQQEELIQTLFRKEFSKMVAVISKLFGLQHIEIAEDIISETFLTASESWQKNRIPPNPTAWLYRVAKQKSLYNFRRQKIFADKIVPELKASGERISETLQLSFSLQNIQDSQLEMMFAVCNPAIASEAQIGLALRILCGFGIEEIAEAFFTSKETINKRLFRAKEKLRREKIRLELPAQSEIVNRLDTVLHIIYLLFNEGYYSATKNPVLQRDFCLEAMRLCLMLRDNAKTNTPKTNALIALMCFHSSRFDARENSNNDIILYEHQNEALWNQELIDKGRYFLNISAQGNEISSYHLEAGIAFWHCQKEDTKEKWENILRHYTLLLEINYSPSIALNRLYALYKVKGNKAALPEAENLQFTNSHFYYTLLGELYQSIDKGKAKKSYEKALTMARTLSDKQTLQSKIDCL